MVSNLAIRVLTSIILAPLVLTVLYLGSPYFDVVGVLVLLRLVWEWVLLTKMSFSDSFKTRGLRLMGILYICTSITCLISLSRAFSSLLIIWILGIVWTTDTAAYFCGRLLKGPKFAPRISPNKTWSGFFGGCAFGTLAGVLVSTFIPLPLSSMLEIVFVSLLLSITAHLGDLFESAAKRYYGAKDTSTLIPGHGGLLDRLDSLLAVSLVAYILFTWGKF